MNRALLTLLILAIPSQTAVSQEQKTRDELVVDDRQQYAEGGFWIYNDLDRGITEARATDKPLLVVFRCIPCEACAQLDSDIAERDPAIRDLLEQFVCVRIVQCNGLDLNLFQFDYDQSFAAFFLNADKAIYGRYGTRSHRTESEDDVTLEGFAAALRGALAIHKEYPQNKHLVAGKRPRQISKVAVPEEFPSLKDMYGPELNYSNQVARSCIHCHQVGEAQREIYRAADQAIPESLLFPYPHPKSIGLIIDPDTRASVKMVVPGSLAADSGFESGDRIRSLDGNTILSMADIQWVLHNAGDACRLAAEVTRDDKSVNLELNLPSGWRRHDTISWRATTWALRRMVTGGMVLAPVGPEERDALDIAADRLALRVDHVGQYGPHALAKNAGFKKGDIVTRVGDQWSAMRETDLIVHLLENTTVNDTVPFTVLRDGKTIELQLKMQQ